MIPNHLSWLSQGRDEIVIRAAPQEIWSILEDSRLLAKWMPAVKRTDGKIESLGSVRHCDVDFDGRAGLVTEQCVVCERHRRIGWHLLEDNLGFSRVLKHFTFDFMLRPINARETLVTNTSYFEPSNLFARFMIALVLRSKFAQVRRRVLANLKNMAERQG